MGDVGFLGGGAPPDISQGRTISEFEKQLRERLTQDFGKLFDDLTNNIEERRSKMLRGQREVPAVDPIELAMRGGTGGGGSSSPILRAFQDEILRFGPQAPSPDKQVELLQKQIEEQKLTREALQEMNRNIGKWKGGEIFLRPVGG